MIKSNIIKIYLLKCIFFKCLVNSIPEERVLGLLTNNRPIAKPLETLSSTVDTICAATITTHNGIFAVPDINRIYFRYIANSKNISIPLLSAEKLWQNARFTSHRKIVFMATGWRTTVESTSALPIVKAFLCRNDVNFVLVDTSKYLDTFYKWAAINTEILGQFIARGLQRLVRKVPIENIHLIGHSLGAHIMGAAGRSFFELTGKRLPRITGLDPPKPCFQSEHSLKTLQATDARFVDVIHSNVGMLGLREQLGDADFYPGGISSFPPGCEDILCAHGRSVLYFAESIYPRNVHNFPALKCDSFQQLLHSQCTKERHFYMGFRANTKAHGIFYVPVNADSPYGMKRVKRCH